MRCDAPLKNRIRRAQGQMEGVLRMMESDNECKDLLTQLKAIRASIDKAIGLLTAENLIQSLEKDLGVELDRSIDALDLIVKGR
ncbi:MAG: metal-sensing transcriptional repressor [Bacillota bacterium]